MQCPHCHQDHPDNTRVCPNTKLPLGRMIRCPYCGHESRPGSRYCAGCGKALPHPAVREEEGQIVQSDPAASAADSAPAAGAPQSAPGASPGSSATATAPSPQAPRSEERRPSLADAPVILDGAPAAWAAIPTSPRNEAPVAADAPPAANRSWLWGALGLLVLVGLFATWRALITPPAPEQPPQAVAPTFTNAPTFTPSTPSATATEVDATLAVIPLLQTQTLLAAPSVGAPDATRSPEAATQLPETDTPPADPSSTAAVEPVADPAGFAALSLAFVSYQSGSPALFLMNPDAPSAWKQVALPDDYEISGVASFCGDEILFEAEDRQLNLPRWIFTYDEATDTATPLILPDPQPERIYSPGCSPSGRYLVFNAMRQGRWFLNVLDRTTQEIIYEQSALGFSQLGMVSWVNAEDRFMWQAIKGEQLFTINQTVNLGSAQPVRTLRFSLDGKYPAISPDGGYIAYFCGNYSRLCMMSWPGKVRAYELPISYFKKIDGKTIPATVSWASDGEWVYFSSSITGNWDIYRMHPDGSQMQNLTESSTADEILPTAR